MALRIITFHAGANSISPSTAQYAGIQGDHCVTDLVFVLDKELISGDYLYRLEFVDGMNAFDTTELLTISAAGTITVPLIRVWTLAGGAGEARLVISKLNKEQSEELILYTLVGRVYFERNNDCQTQEQDTVRGLTSLIAGVKQAQSNAYQAAAYVGRIADDVRNAADAANSASDEAKSASDSAVKTTTMLLEKACSGAFDGHGLSVLGIYNTLAELQKVHFKGERGDAYAIGTATANDLYVWNPFTAAWQNVGNVLGSWTMNDLCLDAGDWNSGVGGWMMDSLCLDAGDWNGPGGAISTLAEHESDTYAHSNLILDGNRN